MELWLTYYVTIQESDFPLGDDAEVRAPSGDLIARVSSRFANQLCIEGAGILRDGRVINVAGSCSNGISCLGSSPQCYHVIDGNRFPWGIGSHGNPLVPLTSIAADQAVLPFGTIVYMREWDGVQIPRVGDLGGFVHNGCFRVDDVGGAIRGNHYDFFAGTTAMMNALERIHPTRSTFNATPGASCAVASMTSRSNSVIGPIVGATLVAIGAWLLWESGHPRFWDHVAPQFVRRRRRRSR